MSQWLRTRPIAHRGLHDNRKVPENSLPAFRACLDRATPIELDVRLTRDGQAVVVHDARLDRLCGRDIRVRDLSWEAVRSLDLLGTKERIPLFAEVLALVAGRVPLLVEIKNRGRAGRLERRVAEALDGYQGECAVQSFNPWTVLWFRRNRPGLSRGQLVCDDRNDRGAVRRFLRRNMAYNLLTGPMFVAVDIRMLRGAFLERMARSRLPVLVWTVRSAGEREFCREMGFNYIFDPPLGQGA